MAVGKGKAKATSRKSATKSTSTPKTGAKSQVGAKDSKPLGRSVESRSKIAKASGDSPDVTTLSSREQASGKAASLLIDQRIRDLGGWRGETLARMRALILEADPDVIEEWKWMGTPVWSHNGIICTGETYKNVVKLTFAKGARTPDPARLFNSSLEGNTRRAIDLHKGEKINARAFKALVRAAVSQNDTPTKKAKPGAKAAKPTKMRKGEKVDSVLLTGGNPQIAKADGDAPVQAYIAAMPGWKRELGTRLDALIVKNAPAVRKAVKWNSPFYGIEGQGWFVSFHVFTKYVKVTFFRGLALEPVPPGGTVRSKEARWIDIYEGDTLDEVQMATWVQQAAGMTGWLA